MFPENDWISFSKSNRLLMQSFGLTDSSTSNGHELNDWKLKKYGEFWIAITLWTVGIKWFYLRSFNEDNQSLIRFCTVPSSVMTLIQLKSPHLTWVSFLFKLQFTKNVCVTESIFVYCSAVTYFDGNICPLTFEFLTSVIPRFDPNHQVQICTY